MIADLTRRPRTKRIFSEEDMLRMRDLYYDRDRPMIEVADAFGVPVSTFLRWIAEMGWPRRSAFGRGMDRAPCHEGPPTQSQAGNAGLSTGPSPQGGGEQIEDEAGAGPTIHDERFAIEVAAAARRELAALGDLAGPVDKNLTLAERERRAALIANLSRAIARIDRVFELRTERKALRLRVKQLEAELATAREADVDALVTQTAKAVFRHFAKRDFGPKPKEAVKRMLYTPPDFL